MDAARPHWLTASETARLIAGGALTSEDHVRSCLARIEEAEADVQAWAHLDPDFALDQARDADQRRMRGLPCGPLHGVAIGMEDVFDVRGQPTGDGTVLHAGRMPRRDATVVSRLRGAGAVILGKTGTSELGSGSPGKARHPRDPGRTPGGSSGGSAAAVAAGMVPAAVSSQTDGSAILSASFCGVYGFKPSFGLIPRGGILARSRPLDQVGVLARSLADLALVTECIAGFDEGDADTQPPRARPPLAEVLAQEPPLPPRLALVRTTFWGRLDADMRAAFDELAQALGGHAQELDLPESTGEVSEWQQTLLEADLAASFELEYDRGAGQLSPGLRGRIERGREVRALDYRKALERIERLSDGFAELFSGFDAIVTPAALGTAPRGVDSAGDPLLTTLWAYCGLPALSLPLARGNDGMPLGIQMVGARGDDARLLRTARWLCAAVATED